MNLQVRRCLGISGTRFPGMLLMVAAAPQEFAGFPALVKHDAPGVRWMATTVIRGADATLVANGAGRAAATSAVKWGLDQRRVRAVVSTGFAGALDPSLRIGDLFLATTIFGDGRRYQGSRPLHCPADLRRGALLTVDRVVQSSEAKRRLARRGAQAVDMEAASVAALAAEHRLPFYCLRAISDGADQDLPVDFNRALRADGTFSPWNLLAQAALRTDRWGELLGLWRDSRVAARSLADCLSRCDFRS